LNNDEIVRCLQAILLTINVNQLAQEETIVAIFRIAAISASIDPKALALVRAEVETLQALLENEVNLNTAVQTLLRPLSKDQGRPI